MASVILHHFGINDNPGLVCLGNPEAIRSRLVPTPCQGTLLNGSLRITARNVYTVPAFIRTICNVPRLAFIEQFHSIIRKLNATVNKSKEMNAGTQMIEVIRMIHTNIGHSDTMQNAVSVRNAVCGDVFK